GGLTLRLGDEARQRTRLQVVAYLECDGERVLVRRRGERGHRRQRLLFAFRGQVVARWPQDGGLGLHAVAAERFDEERTGEQSWFFHAVDAHLRPAALGHLSANGELVRPDREQVKVRGCFFRTGRDGRVES